jgi:ATP-dependent HslUV protease ATP-binding subunit HslU
LIKQYIALMQTEGVDLEFTDNAIDSLAGIAVDLNASVENIGARRLADRDGTRARRHLVQCARHQCRKSVKIDAAYVSKHVGEMAKNTDLSRFIL